MSNYIYQPIQVHETQELQNFRRGACPTPYENTYLRKSDGGGYSLYLPNIIIKRLTSGAAFGVSLWTLDDVSVGAMTDPGFTNVSLDDPLDAYEAATFDFGYWDLPFAVDEGNYYLKFSTGPGAFWWSDAIHIVESTDGDDLQLNIFPPCTAYPWVKLRWSDPTCVTSGKSTDDETDLLAYPPGMNFWVFLEGCSLVDAEWEVNTEYDPLGNGGKVVSSQFAQKRWKLKGAAVSGAVIDAMQSSAFFGAIRVYVEGMADPLFYAKDIKVNYSTADDGCTYEYEYTFMDDFLSKQGCCPE